MPWSKNLTFTDPFLCQLAIQGSDTESLSCRQRGLRRRNHTGQDAPSKVTYGVRQHDLIVARFEEFLETNPDERLYLTEICGAIGVAERTLRIACEEHFGMGPIRYLALRRMHLARRALLRANPSTATVTQIVTDHGFWELGRFAVRYKALFGESPSVSLQRQPRH